jgi:hypothetical protein
MITKSFSYVLRAYFWQNIKEEGIEFYEAELGSHFKINLTFI